MEALYDGDETRFVDRRGGVERQSALYAAATLADVKSARKITEYLCDKNIYDGNARGWADDTALHALIMRHSPQDDSKYIW